MVYKHASALRTDDSQSNVGGNTHSNHLILGVVGHFPSVSLRRRPIQFVILISFFFSPASDAGFSLFCSPRYSACLSSVHLRRMLSGIWFHWIVYLPVAPCVLFRKTPLVSGFRFCLYVPFSVRAFLHDLLPAVLTEIVSVSP